MFEFNILRSRTAERLIQSFQTSTKRQPLPQRLFRLSPGFCSTPSTTIMPSDQSTWLISVPLDGDSEGLLEELSPKLAQQAKLPVQDIAQLQIPSFKVWVTLGDVFARSNATGGRLAHWTRLSRSLRIYRSKTLSSLQLSQRALTRSGTS